MSRYRSCLENAILLMAQMGGYKRQIFLKRTTKIGVLEWKMGLTVTATGQKIIFTAGKCCASRENLSLILVKFGFNSDWPLLGQNWITDNIMTGKA